jgi:uncharacterized protein (DUF39 family)
MGTLKTLGIVANVSEGVQVNANICAVRVLTSASSTITVEQSIDGTNYSAIADISLTIDGPGEFNLSDIVPGQYIRVVSTATMTDCKILF